MAIDIADIPLPKRTRSISFYLVLICFVLPFWSFIPFSWAFVVYSINTGKVWSYAWKGRLVFGIALSEVIFSIYHLQLAQRVGGPTTYGPADPAEIQSAYSRLLKAGLASLPVMGGDEESLDVDRPGSPEESLIQLERDDHRAIDFRHSLRTWFCKAPWSHIKLHQIRQWLYWSMYNSDLPSLDVLPRAQRVALDEAIDLLQKRVGTEIEEGSNTEVHPIRFTIDKVSVNWRPLSSYAFVGLTSWGLKKMYRNKWNVQVGSHEGMEYLIRVPEHWDASTGPHPIVFVHGLGLGLLQYHVVLSHLFVTFIDRPILVPLQPHISQDFFHPNFLKPMTRHQTADKLAHVLSNLGWAEVEKDDDDDDGEEEDEINDVYDKEKERLIKPSVKRRSRGVTMVSHSNGSYTHAWMLKGHPKMIARSCFVDPVTFCSWEGDVCYNFIYRPAMTGMELLIRYFVGTEIGVANLLQRHFDWVSNSLWYEEVPNARDPSKTLFVLGGKDDIVNSARVKRYLTSHGVKNGLWYDPNGRHGQALITGGPGHNAIIEWLQQQH